MTAHVAPLYVRSGYSLLEGVCSPKQLLTHAAELGYSHCALTDVNSLAGATVFAKHAASEGIHPLIGAELRAGTQTILAIAASQSGYENLCQIITDILCHEQQTLTQSLESHIDGLHFIVTTPTFAKSLMTVVPGENLWLGLDPAVQSSRLVRQLTEASQSLSLPLVALASALLLEPQDQTVARLLAAIRTQTTFEDVDPAQLPPKAACLRTWTTFQEQLREWPAALDNNQRLASMCEGFSLLPRKPVFPAFICPDEMPPQEYLRQLCLKGAQWRYPERPPAGFAERLERELNLIEAKGFPQYFLVVWDIVSYARSLGVPVAGRGSGASSLVAYLLGITNVCPLTYAIPFERFLNEHRTDFPDLDIDFCWRIRDEVIDYAFKRWGQDHVAMVCTHNTFQPRSALRETAKAFGLSNKQISQLERNDSLNETGMQQILTLANRITHLPHLFSVHPGGIVMSSSPIDHHVPIQPAAKGVLVTQMDKDGVEDIGLVKLDLLGNRSLSTIRGACQLVRERHNLSVDVETIPADDPQTIETLQAANTIGCNQLESPAMRHLLRAIRPNSLRDIMKALALIRPGAASLGMKDAFLRRQRGLEPADTGNAKLDSILADSNGVMLYEDDVMLVAAALLGLGLAEGDRFRKAIQKCRDDTQRAELSRQFLQRCNQQGIDIDLAKELWVQMAKFNAYSFCRAHAGSYARLGWAVAFLKTHYRLEFWTSALNNNQSMYPHRLYVEQAKREGVRFLLPDVNRSEEEFSIDNNAIRVGFNRIAGLGPAGIGSILNARASIPFQNLTDFLSRCRLADTEVRTMILCGAFDSFGLCRPALMMEHNLFPRKAPRTSRHQPSLLAMSPTLGQEITDYSEMKKYADERRILGLSVGKHIMEWYRPRLGARINIDSRDIAHQIGKRVCIAGMLEAFRGTRTQDGRQMTFLTLDDEYGVFEVTVFPGRQSRSPAAFDRYGPWLVSGRVEEQFDSVTINADAVSFWQKRDEGKR